jgi:hypothetical protein
MNPVMTVMIVRPVFNDISRYRKHTQRGTMDSPRHERSTATPIAPRTPVRHNGLTSDSYIDTLEKNMLILEREFDAHGVRDIFRKLEAPRWNCGPQPDRHQQAIAFGFDFDAVMPQICRKEVAKLKQAPHMARRMAAGEFKNLVPGSFAVADPKREGFWRALSHDQKAAYLEGWLEDKAQEELDDAVMNARPRWMRTWATRIDVADEMRKDLDAKSATKDELELYLHVANAARKFRKLQNGEERKPKRFRRALTDDLFK